MIRLKTGRKGDVMAATGVKLSVKNKLKKERGQTIF
jgi:hypothetical protein